VRGTLHRKTRVAVGTGAVMLDRRCARAALRALLLTTIVITHIKAWQHSSCDWPGAFQGKSTHVR
jgi:hypothetical protein